MVKIKVRHNEPLEKALNRFREKLTKSGLLKEVHDKRRFKKPSEIKAEKTKERKRRIYFENKNK